MGDSSAALVIVVVVVSRASAPAGVDRLSALTQFTRIRGGYFGVHSRISAIRNTRPLIRFHELGKLLTIHLPLGVVTFPVVALGEAKARVAHQMRQGHRTDPAGREAPREKATQGMQRAITNAYLTSDLAEGQGYAAKYEARFISQNE